MTKPLVVHRRSAAASSGAPAADDIPAQLASESDALSRSFEAATNAIAAQNYGVYGCVEVGKSGDPDDAVYVTWSLAFAKHNDAWQLVFEKLPSNVPEEFADVIEIASAPRWVRRRAADKLPELVRKLRKNAEKELHEVKVARAKVEAFVAALLDGTALAEEEP